MNKSTVFLALLSSLAGGIVATLLSQAWLVKTQADTRQLAVDAVPTMQVKAEEPPGLKTMDNGGGESVSHLSRKLIELEEELRQEQSSRLQLARQLDDLDARLVNVVASIEENEAVLALESNQVELAHSGVTNEGRPANGWRQPRDAEARRADLQAAGVGEMLAAEIVSRQEELQLAELDLRDRAAREGWLDSESFDSQLSDLQEASPDLRAELGDAAYDRYLFTAGRPNRVLIRSVIGGSAADLAGVLVGDVLIRYADQRLFSVTELQTVTRQGVRGESVALEIQRNDDRFDTTIQRGPMGVTLGMQVAAPDS